MDEQPSCINCSIWLDEVVMVFAWIGLPGK